jgi:hypothetical protein
MVARKQSAKRSRSGRKSKKKSKFLSPKGESSSSRVPPASSQSSADSSQTSSSSQASYLTDDSGSFYASFGRKSDGVGFLEFTKLKIFQELHDIYVDDKFYECNQRTLPSFFSMLLLARLTS